MDKSRQYCFLPDGIFITHIFLIAQHPHTVQEGGQLSELSPVKLNLESLSFDAQKHMECVLDKDDGGIFSDMDPEKEAEHPRVPHGYLAIPRTQPMWNDKGGMSKRNWPRQDNQSTDR